MSPKPVAFDHQRQCWVQYVRAVRKTDNLMLQPPHQPEGTEIWKVTRCGHGPGIAFVLANGGRVPKGVRECYACKHAGEFYAYPKGGPTKP